MNPYIVLALNEAHFLRITYQEYKWAAVINVAV